MFIVDDPFVGNGRSWCCIGIIVCVFGWYLACQNHPLEEGCHDIWVPSIVGIDGIEFVPLGAGGSNGSSHEFGCRWMHLFEVCHPLEEKVGGLLMELEWQALVIGTEHLRCQFDFRGKNDVVPIGHAFQQCDIASVYGFVGVDLLVSLL